MSRVTRFRIGRATAATGSALLPLLAAAVAVPAMAASAAPSPSVVNLYVAPHAPGTTAAATAAETGSAQQPFTSIAQAAQSAHQLSASSDVVVHLAAGKYQLTQPLTFTSADAGQNGHTISYAGAAGQATVMSGSAPVTGWTLQNQSSNIWVASVGTGVNTRQLYVNGAEAPRAAISVPRSDFTFTSTGLTITSSSLNYLAGLTDQNQIEVESVDSFTDRYAPVASISGSTITMQQPAWANNNWGYDVMAQPFAGRRDVPGEQLLLPAAGRAVVPGLAHRPAVLQGRRGPEPEQPRHRAAEDADPGDRSAAATAARCPA